MKITYVTSECVPFIKTGGLADIVAALSIDLSDDHNISVVLPLYSQIKIKLQTKLDYIGNFYTLNEYIGIFKYFNNNITYYFIDNESLFNRNNIYGYSDDGYRFGVFSRAVLDLFEFIDEFPQIIHLNDWHTSMIPYILKSDYKIDYRYTNLRTLLTIHNLQYQGIFDINLRCQLHLDYSNDYIFNNQLNFLKCGIQCSDYINTVSFTYRNETLSPNFGCGLDQILRNREHYYWGILNGIDYTIYNPATDKNIIFSLNNESIIIDKKINKRELYSNFNINIDDKLPLYSMVSRITSQKGFDILNEILNSILYKDIVIFILGSGDSYYTDYLHRLHCEHDNFYFYNGYNEKLSHMLYAAGDFFLMPSAFEPSGLSQMIALRYGNIPIIHEVGGLKDSIIPYNEFNFTGNGITFSKFTANDLYNAINYSLYLYYNNTHHKQLVKNAIKTELSIEITVQNYLHLYELMLSY